MAITGACYYPNATSDPQQMVIQAARSFFSDTGRYPTHAAISRLCPPMPGGNRIILNDPFVAVMVAYRDDVGLGWVKCVYRPFQATFIPQKSEGAP